MSSANIIGSSVFEGFFKLFTYKRNKSGPKIEHQGCYLFSIDFIERSLI